VRRLASCLVGVWLAGGLGGCEGEPRRDPALARERHVQVEELPAPSADEELPPPIAEPSTDALHAHETPEVLPAAAVDGLYASDEHVPARRFVYRVRLEVPSVLGEPRGGVATPAAELFVDVSADRLRARFSGTGLPIETGSEVRLRGDSPGAYVFDERGGRALLPGELASWFEGGPPRAGPVLSVRRDPALRSTVDPGPGVLLCALLAEWSGEPRDNVMRRCATGAPLFFRVGFWHGERTADVPIELARRAVRADHLDPPPPVVRRDSGAFLEATAQARLAPLPRRHDEPVDDGRGPLPEQGLALVNESDARMVVVADGVAIGWVAAGATGLFPGLPPGVHEIAGMRPLGAVVMRPREVALPGRTILHAPRRPSLDAGVPAPR
jgi:hypothetical protein